MAQKAAQCRGPMQRLVMGATLAPANSKAAFATAKSTLAGGNGLAALTALPPPTFRVAPMQRAARDSTQGPERSQEERCTVADARTKLNSYKPR